MTVHEVKASRDLSVGRAEAFSFLSSAEHLQGWFAEHVQIDAQIGGQFVFDGRGAYLPTATKLTTFEPEIAIGWDWPMHGANIQVSITLSAGEDAKASRIEVTCICASLPDIPRGRELIEDIWLFHLGSLSTYARDTRPVALPDFSDPAQEVRDSIFIAAPRATVYRALIDPKLLSQWSGAKAEVEPHPGGKYSIGWDPGPTQILDMRENEYLIVDWPDWRGDASNSSQQIKWILADEGAGTRLTIIHTGFARATDISDFPFGWTYFLVAIRKAVLANAM